MPEIIDIRLKILLVSRRKEVLDSLQTLLRSRPGLAIERKLVVNGHIDPLHGVAEIPDVLVLHLGDTWRAELESLAARAADTRPPLIVLGSTQDAAAMRLAMQAGARDLLPLPLVEADLFCALERIARDHQASNQAEAAALTVFLNAKGGCGGTFLACNVAHILASRLPRQVALIDLDMQFGAIPLYFDLYPGRGLMQALENLEELDETALEAYLVRPESGLAILGQATQDALPLGGFRPDSVSGLLRLLGRSHMHVLVDLPRHIDALACRTIERAERIVLVVQQSVTVLRDATRLMSCLRRELAVSPERILTVINRYDKRSTISADDVRNTLSCGEPILVPNDYRCVEESISTGRPLLSHARTASVTKSIGELADRICGAQVESRGLLARAFAKVSKPRSS